MRPQNLNSETNNKFPGDDGIAAEFYEHFSNKLAPAFLDVYDSCRKVGTMAFLEQQSYVLYKKGYQKDIPN